MNIQQIFQNKVFHRYGVEYGVIGTYTDSRTKVKIKHNRCGHTWDANPSTFLSKTKPTTCPRCSPYHNRKLSNEDFKDELYNLVGDEYTPLDSYVNRSTKIKMRHNTCEHVWKVTPNAFVISGTRCPECSKCSKKSGFKWRKLTEEEFLRRVGECCGEEYEVVGTFLNTSTTVKTKHLVCNYEWNAHPDQLMKKNGSRCPECSGRKLKTTEWFRNEVFAQVGVEYQVIGEYVNAKTKVPVQHNICGHKWDVLPRKFVGSEKTRCPKCFKPAKKHHEEFVHDVYLAVGDEYSVLSQYKAKNKHVKMKHNKCGHTWKLMPCNFLHSVNPTRCPKCNESKGEKRISAYLSDLSLPYQSQYRIPECKYIRPLPFDFAIIIDGSLKLLIEFDGQQHFMPIEQRGGMEEFKIIQKRDQIKTDFCKSNQIPLLRIPYHKINEVEDILYRALRGYGVLPNIQIKYAA